MDVSRMLLRTSELWSEGLLRKGADESIFCESTVLIKASVARVAIGSHQDTGAAGRSCLLGACW